MRTQLGHADALDRWQIRHGVRVRARPPSLIYHICAGNLAVSAWTSLAHGLLLGAHNAMKLPGDRDDSTARREILDFVRGLPKPLRGLVKTHRKLDEKLFSRADVIVAFGSDATMGNLRARIGPGQRFIAHGHALSLLWIAEPEHITASQARACALDVLAYDQLGCLSPQAIYTPVGGGVGKLGDKLARALEVQWRTLRHKPPRPLPVAARITEARDVALALGHRVWLPPDGHLGWTLVHDPDPAFQPSPLHGVIYLRTVAESKLAGALASVAGRISTVGVAGRMSSRLERAFLNLGVSRFCPAGRMQFPPLTWHHDGRPVLGDLVTWIDSELPA
jgi:hypothetical protein